ncbi:MAG: hypothetical protein IK066_07695, partial [Kiritimatiellae bacterium]|nr:hypothetical protein [Kiritimatiellia bacterium]
GTPVVARVRLREVAVADSSGASVRLVAASTGGTLAEWPLAPGPLRAFFSDPFSWPEGGVRAEWSGATAGEEPEVRVRVAGECPRTGGTENEG